MATVPAVNPFGIESVVEHLFRYLRLEDIITLRAVCKTWHKIGTKRLKERIDEVQIVFGSNFSLHVPDPRKTIENFLQMQQNCSFQFTNFASFYFDSNLRGKIPTAEQTAHLFEQCGVQMKKVKLDLDGKFGWKFLSDVLMTKSPNIEELHLHGYPEWPAIVDKKLFTEGKTPELKLKSIILHSYDEVDEQKPVYNSEFLTDLFRASRHLESLTVELDMENSESEFNHELLVLNTLIGQGNISSLKVLSLHEVDGDEFEILASSFNSAPLQEFYGHTTQLMSVEMISDIETFIKNHKDTWTILYLVLPCVECYREINFPKLINLTSLSIREWCIDEAELEYCETPIGMIDFGQQFPKLETLNLCEDVKSGPLTFFDLDQLFPDETTPLLSLKNLTLPPQRDPIILRRIGHMFPNVTNLDLAVCSAETLKELWITWPELKMLTVSIISDKSFLSTSLDAIFIGVPDASLDKSSPYIGRLKRLTHLVIKDRSNLSVLYIKGPSIEPMLTDHSVGWALAHLKELSFLYISNDRHQISQSGIECLCTTLGLQRSTAKAKALRLVKYEWQNDIQIF